MNGDVEIPTCAIDESTLTNKTQCDNSCVKMVVNLEGKIYKFFLSLPILNKHMAQRMGHRGVMLKK